VKALAQLSFSFQTSDIVNKFYSEVMLLKVSDLCAKENDSVSEIKDSINKLIN
jgi:hypothetical protein